MAGKLTRRAMLSGLGSALVVAGCGRLARGESAAPLTVPGACDFEGATPGAVTGPFPPSEFRPILRGERNPGAILAVEETDLDLVHVANRRGTARGQVVRVRGQVLGPGCRPAAGADIQLWQADAAGRYNHRNEGDRITATDLDPAFGYWGRAVADAEGRFTLLTIVPGAYPAGTRWWRPPHLHWTITAPGLAPVTTQSFFDGEVLTDAQRIRQLNQDDHILNIRRGFEGALAGEPLAVARRRLREEMVARFALAEDGVPTGELTFRLA